MKISTVFSLVAVVALALLSWRAVAQQHMAPMAPHVSPKAIAVLGPTQGQTAHGWVKFEAVEKGIRVTAEISGLAPGSQHGFHIHEFGDLRSTDGTSLGGHYNPGGKEHGLTHVRARHAGDLGNVEADASGVAKVDRVFIGFSIDGHLAPILGRGVVVHALQDDGGQPTGNAGGRIAVGVVGVARE